MKTVLALTLVVLSVTVLAGCPDNNTKPGTTPAAASGAPAASGNAAPADTSKSGSGW
jgi:hypothetical protein